MSRPGLKVFRRWLVPAALLAAVPKCVLCLMAYAGLGTALGLGGPELCGTEPEPGTHENMLLALLGVRGLLPRWRNGRRICTRSGSVFGGAPATAVTG